MPRIKTCDICGGNAHFDDYCGCWCCENCDNHIGLARCYCGWSLSGFNGREELIEMGETIGDLTSDDLYPGSSW
jgi:hypothetical protein